MMHLCGLKRQNLQAYNENGQPPPHPHSSVLSSEATTFDSELFLLDLIYLNITYLYYFFVFNFMYYLAIEFRYFILHTREVEDLVSLFFQPQTYLYHRSLLSSRDI